MMAAIKKIGTHDGVFHCDEALACYMLKKLPEYINAQIIRTRDPKILDTCDIVVDVGAEYDPSRHRYDHHQQSFDLTMNSLSPAAPWTIKLSSAGLVFHHFGINVLSKIVGKENSSDLIQKLHHYMYQNFIQEIDGVDNGIPMFDGEPKYRINTGLSSRVANLNPAWNSTEPYDSDLTFSKAMELVGSEFEMAVDNFIKSWWPAREIVSEAVTNRFKVHKSGEILKLSHFCPWKEHLSIIEEEEGLGDTIKFVLFKDSSEKCRVQAVPLNPKSFVCRVFLNEKWMGLRDDELCKVSGVAGCIFVHSTGFIGGNTNMEGALQMAIRSLELHRENN